MTLTLDLHAQPEVPLEIEGLHPAALRALTTSEIARHQVHHGNRSCELGEFFRVQGDARDMALVFQGDLRHVHWLGAHMSEGTVRVEGSAGRHVGSGMFGGVLEVRGDVGDYAGGEMRGGRLSIHGNAGDLLGAGYYGSRRG
ncbi:MAG TPA: formylmethanofuran dehydrogenase subunit C, partial [Pirellulaceae bacterium]